MPYAYQQINSAVIQSLKAFFPFAGFPGNLPLFQPGYMIEQIYRESGWFACLVSKGNRRIFFITHAKLSTGKCKAA